MVFGRRTARRGVAQTVARTALIAGTATAASNAVSARSVPAAPAAQPVAPAAAPAAAEAGVTLSLIEQLEKLGALHTSGVITDEEFAELKRKAIG